MRRVCVTVAFVLEAALLTRSLHAQGPRPGDDFQIIPDAFAPTEILKQLTVLIGQRDYRGYRQYRFLIFVAPENTDPKWRLARYADTAAKYRVPEYELEARAGRSFFVVENDTGGTGVAEYGNTWYELKPNADGAALDLPERGHDEFLSLRPRNGPAYILTHEWQANVVRPAARDNTVRVDLTATYAGYTDAGRFDLFKRQQSATFVWDDTAAKFTFDRPRSDLSEQEFRDVYREEGLNAESFARYNAAEVNRIFDGGSVEAQRALTALGIKRVR